jgi:hypothetical protein
MPEVFPMSICYLRYLAADLLICARCQDNLPNVISRLWRAEFLSSPSNVGGVSDLVRDGRTRGLVPLEDVSALSRAVRMLITDDDLRTLSAESRMIAVTEYAIPRQAERYRKVYEQCWKVAAVNEIAILHCHSSLLKALHSGPVPSRHRKFRVGRDLKSKS